MKPAMGRSRASITGVELTPLRIPFRHSLRESVGQYDEITPVILKIHTTEGITGVGEIQSYPLFEREGVEPQAGILAILQSHFIPLLLGLDPFQIESIWSRMDAVIKGHLWIKAGIDIALYDLMGKALNVPAY